MKSSPWRTIVILNCNINMWSSLHPAASMRKHSNVLDVRTDAKKNGNDEEEDEENSAGIRTERMNNVWEEILKLEKKYVPLKWQ